MKIVTWSELYALTDSRKSHAERQKDITASLLNEFPIYSADLSGAVKIKYDAKTDRYVGTFGDDTYRLAVPVAKFLAEHHTIIGTDGTSRAAYVYLRMSDEGLIDDCCLVRIV